MSKEPLFAADLSDQFLESSEVVSLSVASVGEVVAVEIEGREHEALRRSKKIAVDGYAVTQQMLRLLG